ncbi:unnamed protein product [marine sediment metagenome]|uniref:Uncharacterized protein n=1 Tax=marine sediment metagenome TaxID=412755 RepID=X0ZB95_9ZZZZ
MSDERKALKRIEELLNLVDFNEWDDLLIISRALIKLEQEENKSIEIVNQMIEESKVILVNVRQDFGAYDTSTRYASVELEMLKEVKRKLEEANEVE